MFQHPASKNINSSHLRPADSFVVDLRSKLAPTVTAANDKIIKPEPKLAPSFKLKQQSTKRRLSFSLFKPRQASSVNFFKHFLLGERKRRLTLSWHFSWPLKSTFFSHWRSHKVLDLPVNRRARRHFARASALRWKQLRRLTSTKNLLNKQTKTTEAEYLVSWYRSVFAFMAALVFIILPFKLLAYFKILDFQHLKSNIINSSFSAFDNLASASDGATNLDMAAAGNSFARAASDFKSAQQELERVDDWLLSFASFSNDPKIKLAATGKKFLAAGAAASALGQHLSAAGSVLLNTETDKSWGSLIDSFVEHGSLALISAQELQANLQAIEPQDLPQEYRERFLSFRQQADLAVNALDSLLDSAQAIKNFIGVSQDKRYLLVFQNNSEMRGAGGFLGSYALVDIRDGAIRKLEVPAGGTYDTEAGMKSFIQSPKPLWLVSPRWYLWDANWWPDWPTSAKALMWFYDKSDGPTVDGVISFTPDVLEDLLRITGPIDLQAEYGLTIDADNFWELIQGTVEKDNLIKTHPEEVADLPDSPANQPKKIIGDLMAEIMLRLPSVLSPENVPALLSALENNLSAKNIMLYFSDADLQARAARYGLDGAMSVVKYDYLMVAHTNIAGQKSDRRMQERIEHHAQVMSDGSIIDELTIYRAHTGIKNEILSGVRNVDWLRVYVPQGSQLLSASGFKAPEAFYFEQPESTWEIFPLLAETENLAVNDLNSGTKIYQENGKTVFANWVMTDPGETAVIKLRYRLPFRLKNNVVSIQDWWSRIDRLFNQEADFRSQFSLLVQKQPGASPATVDLSLDLPPTWRQVWNYPEQSLWHGQATLDRDILRAVLLEK